MKRLRWPKYVQWVGWEPRDLWIGVYWDQDWLPGEIAVRRTQVYICLVPCFPIRLVWIEDRRWPTQEVPRA